eukprot:Rhum_TRINITY_DN14249_c21_g1::Rhum_TRINITY_DN14249_c21_g1_i1::g.76980::m.76980
MSEGGPPGSNNANGMPNRCVTPTSPAAAQQARLHINSSFVSSTNNGSMDDAPAAAPATPTSPRGRSRSELSDIKAGASANYKAKRGGGDSVVAAAASASVLSSSGRTRQRSENVVSDASATAAAAAAATAAADGATRPRTNSARAPPPPPPPPPPPSAAAAAAAPPPPRTSAPKPPSTSRPGSVKRHAHAKHPHHPKGAAAAATTAAAAPPAPPAPAATPPALHAPRVFNLGGTGERVVLFGPPTRSKAPDAGRSLRICVREVAGSYTYKGEVSGKTMLPQGSGSLRLHGEGREALVHANWSNGRLDTGKPAKVEYPSDAVFYGFVVAECVTPAGVDLHAKGAPPLLTSGGTAAAAAATPSPASPAAAPATPPQERLPAGPPRGSVLINSPDAVGEQTEELRRRQAAASATAAAAASTAAQQQQPADPSLFAVSGAELEAAEVEPSPQDAFFTSYARSLRVSRSGMGELCEHASGERHFGNWQADKRTGYGVSLYADGGKYYGSWEGGVRSGMGVYLGRDGLVYEGGFKQDEYSGEGALYLPNGTGVSGVYRGGQAYKGQKVFQHTPSRYAQVRACLDMGAKGFEEDLSGNAAAPSAPSSSTLRWRNFRPTLARGFDEERAANNKIESAFSRIIVRHVAANKARLGHLYKSGGSSGGGGGGGGGGGASELESPVSAASGHFFASGFLSMDAQEDDDAASQASLGNGGSSSILNSLLAQDTPESLEKLKQAMDDSIAAYLKSALDLRSKHPVNTLCNWFQRYFTFMYGTCGDARDIGSGPPGVRGFECGYFGRPTDQQRAAGGAGEGGAYVNLTEPAVNAAVRPLSYCLGRQHFAGCIHRSSARPNAIEAFHIQNALEDMGTFAQKLKDAVQKCFGPMWSNFFAQLGLLPSAHRQVNNVLLRRAYPVLRNLYAAAFRSDDLHMSKKLQSLSLASLDDVGVTYARNRDEEVLFPPYVGAVGELASLPSIATLADKLVCLTKVAKEVDQHTMYNLLREVGQKRAAKKEAKKRAAEAAEEEEEEEET